MDNTALTQVLGIVGFENKGEYSPNVNYEKNDIVKYNGSSYCAKTNVSNVAPTNESFWQLYAEKGDKGDTGEEGYTPVKGTDYYTAEDKAELEATLSSDVTSEVTSQLGGLTSATPLVASDVSEMTDTTRVYVLTIDGHWYWYDGDSWEDGGIYQATGVETDKTLSVYNKAADSFIAGQHLNALATFNALNLIIPSTFTSGKYINPVDGSLANNSTFSVSDYIEIESNTNYRLNAHAQVYAAYYDNSKTFISSLSYNRTIIWEEKIKSPANAKYIRISCVTNNIAELSYKLHVENDVVLNPNLKIPTTSVIPAYNTTVIDVKPNGGGDYTTIKDAFSAITDSSPTNRYIVNFYGDGNEYDVTQEFTSLSGQIGLRVPPFTKFVGIGGSRKNILVARLDSSNANFSTLNLYQTSELKGFTIKGYNTRYAVHDDFYRSDELGHERIIEDVVAISEGTYYFRAWGAGVRSGMKWTFKDCIFKGNQNLNEGSFSCHNNIEFTDPAELTFINCRCKSSYLSQTIKWAMRFSSIVNNANNIINNINVIGNEIQHLIFTEENASTYGQGMLWYCTGYANDVKTGQIVATDGNNYSDRINLV